MASQLTLPERIVIERMIHQDFTFASIARTLDRSASTIAREVLHYRCFTSRLPISGENDCTRKNGCLRNSICPESGVHGCYGSRCKRCPEGLVCTTICTEYESSQCDLLDKPPYVCSNCKMQKSCKKIKAYYAAHRANASHQKAIKIAHSGVRKTPAELRRIIICRVYLYYEPVFYCGRYAGYHLKKASKNPCFRPSGLTLQRFFIIIFR